MNIGGEIDVWADPGRPPESKLCTTGFLHFQVEVSQNTKHTQHHTSSRVMSTIAVVTSVYLSYSVTAAFTNDIDQETRRLISSSSCASADYTLGCNATNPAGCPCTAFTDEERTQILDAHNERRELAASGNELCATSDGSSVESCPAATDMNALLWDESLEVIATYWAHQFGHTFL